MYYGGMRGRMERGRTNGQGRRERRVGRKYRGDRAATGSERGTVIGEWLWDVEGRVRGRREGV